MKNTGADTSGSDFGSVLADELNRASGITFSKHATERLASRDISLTDADMQRLGSAVEKASEKGLRDPLILMNNVAYIVSVPAKTVVTAVPAGETQQKVFTNIDGAVIA